MYNLLNSILILKCTVISASLFPTIKKMEEAMNNVQSCFYQLKQVAWDSQNQKIILIKYIKIQQEK